MNTRTIAVTAMVAALAVVAILAVRPGSGPAVALGASGQDELTPFLRFSGVGTVQAKPDMAAVTVTTTAEAATTKAALTEVSRKMTVVLNAVKALKDPAIADDDIQSQGVATYPSGKRTERRHQASNSVQILVRAPEKAGAVLAAANAAGAEQVSGPTFTLEDRMAAESEALRKAIHDARAEADAAAAEMGAKVDRVVSVVELGANTQPYVTRAGFRDERGGALAADVDLSAPTPDGRLAVRTEVVVTFAYTR